jgi:hypothetical protein
LKIDPLEALFYAKNLLEQQQQLLPQKEVDAATQVS